VPRLIALLRGVNVGGHTQVAMSDLRDLLAKLGFDDVQSVLQSGNLVFRSGRNASTRIEATLEAECRKRLGVETLVFVRSAAEWEDVVAENPFRDEARRDPARTVAFILKEAPGSGAAKALQAAIVGREVSRVAGSAAYVYYPDGQGRSKVSHTVVEKVLGVRCTGRNWNTVLRLAELVRAL
jgi:uncharacterized protein (DUF1697 family)